MKTQSLGQVRVGERLELVDEREKTEGRRRDRDAENRRDQEEHQVTTAPDEREGIRGGRRGLAVGRDGTAFRGHGEAPDMHAPQRDRIETPQLGQPAVTAVVSWQERNGVSLGRKGSARVPSAGGRAAPPTVRLVHGGAEKHSPEYPCHHVARAFRAACRGRFGAAAVSCDLTALPDVTLIVIAL